MEHGGVPPEQHMGHFGDGHGHSAVNQNFASCSHWSFLCFVLGVINKLMATSIALLLAGAITEVGLATKQSPTFPFLPGFLAPEVCSAPGSQCQPYRWAALDSSRCPAGVPGPPGAPGDNEHTNGARLLISIFYFFPFPETTN